MKNLSSGSDSAFKKKTFKMKISVDNFKIEQDIYIYIYILYTVFAPIVAPGA